MRASFPTLTSHPSRYLPPRPLLVSSPSLIPDLDQSTCIVSHGCPFAASASGTTIHCSFCSLIPPIPSSCSVCIDFLSLHRPGQLQTLRELVSLQEGPGSVPSKSQCPILPEWMFFTSRVFDLLNSPRYASVVLILNALEALRLTLRGTSTVSAQRLVLSARPAKPI